MHVACTAMPWLANMQVVLDVLAELLPGGVRQPGHELADCGVEIQLVGVPG